MPSALALGSAPSAAASAASWPVWVVAWVVVSSSGCLASVVVPLEEKYRLTAALLTRATLPSA